MWQDRGRAWSEDSLQWVCKSWHGIVDRGDRKHSVESVRIEEFLGQDWHIHFEKGSLEPVNVDIPSGCGLGRFWGVHNRKSYKELCSFQNEKQNQIHKKETTDVLYRGNSKFDNRDRLGNLLVGLLPRF